MNITKEQLAAFREVATTARDVEEHFDANMESSARNRDRYYDTQIRNMKKLYDFQKAIGPKETLWILDDLDTALARVKVLEEALEKIKDGWAPPGHMLVMCGQAAEALARSRALGESKDEGVE